MRVTPETVGFYLYHAFLDGQELVGCCVAADEEEGWADCAMRDAEGHLLTDPDNPGELVLQRRTGIVKIVAPQEEELRSHGLSLAHVRAAMAVGHPEVA